MQHTVITGTVLHVSTHEAPSGELHLALVVDVNDEGPPAFFQVAAEGDNARVAAHAGLSEGDRIFAVGTLATGEEGGYRCTLLATDLGVTLGGPGPRHLAVVKDEETP